MAASPLDNIRATDRAPAKRVDPAPGDRSTAVDRDLSILRKCVSDLDYTLDSLESSMGKDRAHINRVLNREKPMSHEFEMALPDDVAALYRRRQAEGFGFVVVEQVDEETAARHFVSGLYGLLAKKRPAA